jgi:D-arabinose 1-dehydrogenase-like Zn-dependent alcohol dehydrogenase
MKAAIRYEFGPPEVLKLEEIPTPVPEDDELLIRVHAASVTLGDWELLTGRPLHLTVIATLFTRRPRHHVPPSGFFKPKFKILGTDVAGRVEAVGKSVTQFRPGDEVFGDCGLTGFGAFAEYVCVPERAALAPKPTGMSFEQAAAIPQAGFIAVQALRDSARVGPGHNVLINGAGGGRPCHRLHARRFHQERAALRRHPGHGRLPDRLREQAFADPQRAVPDGRRRVLDCTLAVGVSRATHFDERERTGEAAGSGVAAK